MNEMTFDVDTLEDDELVQLPKNMQHSLRTSNKKENMKKIEKTNRKWHRSND